MIAHLGGRSVADARVVAQRFLEATKPPARVRGARTPQQALIERERMRAKVAGTKKMRAAILAALDNLRAPVLKAVGLREDVEGDAATAATTRAAVTAAVKKWDAQTFAAAIEKVVDELVTEGAESAGRELRVGFEVAPERAIAAVMKTELAFSKEFVQRERIALQAMLAQHLRDGTPGKELASDIADFFADGVHYVGEDGEITRVLPDDSWADMVARTEASRAYNAGTMDTYSRAGVEYVQWLTAEDERVCPECEALDLQIVARGDDFAAGVDAPPLHPSCAIAGTRILSARGVIMIEDVRVGDFVVTHRNRFRVVRALSRTHVSHDLVEIRVGPHVLRVTEEHPILTSQGWTPATSLEIGDEICAVKTKASLSGAGQPNQIPSGSLQERFLAHVGSRFTGRRMPCSAIDLDGERSIWEADVDAVDVESEVRYARNASHAKHVDDDLLIARVAHADTRASHANAFRVRALRATHGVVRGFRKVGAFLGRRLSHADDHRVAASADRQSQSIETSDEHRPRDARFFRKREDWGARDMPNVERAEFVVGEDASSHIAIVRCDSATRVAFDGLVYNFAVDEDESYVAEGIVSHNCRCATVGADGPGDDATDDGEA